MNVSRAGISFRKICRPEPTCRVSNPEVARIVNQQRRPLVLVGGPIQLLGLSHLVAPQVILQLSEGRFEPPDIDAYSEVFVFTPSGAWLRSLASRGGFTLQPVFDRGKLWALRRTGA